MGMKVVQNLRDCLYALRYGNSAPKFAQLIFVNPGEVNLSVGDRIFERRHSGRVVGGDWDLNCAPVESLQKFLVCRRHFVEGLDWESAGAYVLMRELMEAHPGVDGCRTHSDVVARYERLDALFEQVKAEGRLRLRSEVAEVYRESGGVYIHVSRTCEPIFGLGGIHRLAIARILGLKEIPAQLGVVHEGAVSSWVNCSKIRGG